MKKTQHKFKNKILKNQSAVCQWILDLQNHPAMNWPENLETFSAAGSRPRAQPKVAVVLAKYIFILTVLTDTAITFCIKKNQKHAWKSAQHHIPVL